MSDPRAEAFDAFCAAQYDQLVGAVHLLCGDLGAAEELVQSALERAWSRWDQVSRMESPGGWVQVVAFNLARSGFRRRAAERRAHIRHGHRDQTAPEDATTAMVVREALAQLPERQREAVIHRFHAGRSAAETARIMGISEDAVTQLAYRARQRLRDLLPEEAPVPPPRGGAPGGSAQAVEEGERDG